MYTNILVACSNFIGFYFSTSPYIRFPIFASFFYHLAETKHNLPGIYPLNQYSNLLLNIDRAFAVISFLYVLRNYSKINFIIGVLGLVCLAISERDIIYKNFVGINLHSNLYPKIFHVTKLDFIIFHCFWHTIAYYILASVI